MNIRKFRTKKFYNIWPRGGESLHLQRQKRRTAVRRLSSDGGSPTKAVRRDYDHHIPHYHLDDDHNDNSNNDHNDNDNNNNNSTTYNTRIDRRRGVNVIKLLFFFGGGERDK